MIKRRCAGKAQNIERLAINEGDWTCRRHKGGKDNCEDESDSEGEKIKTHFVHPVQEGQDNERKRNLQLDAVIGQLKISLNEVVLIDPIGVVEPFQAERHIGVRQQLILERERETLYRVCGHDTA